MLSVVEIAGKQYIVAPGETVTVDKIEGKEGETVTFDRVLLISENDKTLIGTPTVKGKKVTATIVKQGKAEKIHVRRFKSKVRYRKSMGFRALETTLQVSKIG